MLKVNDLAFSYSDKPLYKGVSFIVGKGQKVGLVGPNGSGKSTLLNIITGKEDGFTGKVELNGTVALVPQEVKNDPILEDAENARMYVDPNGLREEHELLKFFSGLELNIKLDANPKTLSGGQKTKLALMRALLANPDILLLDEPTNFMDISGKRFVMNFLINYEGTVILISHDIKLIDESIDKVLSVEPQLMQIVEYKGNYTQFIRLKKEKEELLKRQVLIGQKQIKRMEEGYKRMQRMTSKKGVRAKIRQRRRIEKAKLTLPELPQEIGRIKLNLPQPANVGELPVKCSGITKSYNGQTVLTNVDFTIIRGQRIALIGANGTGKSTFIKILLGVVEPDGGEVVKNSQLKVGYYSQEFENFDLQQRLIDTFTEKTKKDESFARSFLGRFAFLQDKVFQKVESLSGGEKTRLAIAILTATDNNLLVLDEPTTYLDVTSQRIILEALKQYKGTMIVVSHTPDFIIELEPQKAFLFPEEKMVFWDEELVERIDEI